MRAFGDPYRPRRRRTREVSVGGIRIGGDQPLRIQSMTNTDTMDTAATVEQTRRLVEAGCEIVRVTAPSIRDAENLHVIRRELRADGIEVPLVADIHFTPNAAMIAAEAVEKVRINPGNYADKKKFEVREYDDSEYEAEIARVAERFRPLVQRCKANGVAMRIGTNHGSLSDRILNRFGDTPEGMVESALEFLDVCEDEAYRDVVFSMKASNTQVAIQAYRLLAARLETRSPGEPSYPFHVGVTEAGDAEDGRIKSAIGIGSLLEDGLGDTIRVSLTEDPVREVPVARAIAQRAEAVLATHLASQDPIDVKSDPVASFYRYERRATQDPGWPGVDVGGESIVRVELELDDAELSAETAARLSIELAQTPELECESLLVEASDVARLESLATFRRELTMLGLDFPLSLRVAIESADAKAWLEGPSASDGDAEAPGDDVARWVARVNEATKTDTIEAWGRAARARGIVLEWEFEASNAGLPELVRRVFGLAPASLVSLSPTSGVHAHRILTSALADVGAAQVPIVLRHRMQEPQDRGSEIPAGIEGVGGGMGTSDEELIDASVRLGALLCDGIGDVVSIATRGAADRAIDLAYRVLQGARRRSTRTEYISCPSCGRTLFDLEETTAKIKQRTDHLKGVKIAVMGCIVNGPGEMADADFGYVGSGPGQVTLYVGQEVVARAVPEAEASDRLIELIREHGRWVDREASGFSNDEVGAAISS